MKGCILDVSLDGVPSVLQKGLIEFDGGICKRNIEDICECTCQFMM